MKPVCIAIVDAAHARLYSYQGEPAVFREVKDLINPGRRGKDRELFSTTQPGRLGINGTDDHRVQHRLEWDRQFARQIVDECLDLVRTRGHAHVIFVSSPRMLGELRQAYVPLVNEGVVVDELERDFAGLTSPQIHDRLADAHLIGSRARAR